LGIKNGFAAVLSVFIITKTYLIQGEFMFKKILLGFLVVIVVVVGGFLIFVFTSYNKTYNDAYPVSELKVPADSALIERGRYLALGPAHCIDCHAPHEALQNREVGQEISLTGGFGLEVPPGKFYAPNITPDTETGIGNLTDGELYRMLRHNILPDGRATIDFMPFFNMTDDDIYALIAYLRSTQPVKNKMPQRELTFLGKMVFAMGAIDPDNPQGPVQKSITPDITAEYGHYLAFAVANCMGCHTERNMQTGEYIGQPYSGGMTFGPDNMTKDWIFVSPNLTPDQQTGRITEWDEESFIDRLKAGRAYDTSPMPWEAYQNMTDNDLKAIYKYLKSVKPVAKVIAETAIAPASNH
jgi:mono/diheme cytochrome c family protein